MWVSLRRYTRPNLKQNRFESRVCTVSRRQYRLHCRYNIPDPVARLRIRSLRQFAHRNRCLIHRILQHWREYFQRTCPNNPICRSDVHNGKRRVFQLHNNLDKHRSRTNNYMLTMYFLLRKGVSLHSDRVDRSIFAKYLLPMYIERLHDMMPGCQLDREAAPGISRAAGRWFSCVLMRISYLSASSVHPPDNLIVH